MQKCRVVLADCDENAMIDWTSRRGRLSSEISTGLEEHDDDDHHHSHQWEYHIVTCDVRQPTQVQNLIQVADHFSLNKTDESSSSLSSGTGGMTNFLVNCAGITRDNWVSNISIKDWEDVIDVNLKGTFLTCQEFLNRKRLQPPESSSISLVKDGPIQKEMAIVNIGSIVSEFGNLGQVNYAASKGGVLGMTRSLAKESARWGIRVNAIVPGFIDTPMAKAVPNEIKEHIILPKIPLGRFGTPEEIANVVAFLLSPRSSYITGESIKVSGMISL